MPTTSAVLNGRKYLIAAQITTPAGHAVFGKDDRSSVPGGLPVDQPKGMHPATPNQHDFVSRRTRHVQVVLALTLPQQMAVAQTQAKKGVRFDGRHEHAASADQGAAVDPIVLCRSRRAPPRLPMAVNTPMPMLGVLLRSPDCQQ